MTNAAFERACRVARARHLMVSGHFSRGYKLIKDMPEAEFITALRMLAAQQNVFERIFQLRDRYKAKESESILRVLKRAADAGDEEALALLATGVLQEPFTDA